MSRTMLTFGAATILAAAVAAPTFAAAAPVQPDGPPKLEEIQARLKALRAELQAIREAHAAKNKAEAHSRGIVEALNAHITERASGDGRVITLAQPIVVASEAQPEAIVVEVAAEDGAHQVHHGHVIVDALHPPHVHKTDDSAVAEVFVHVGEDPQMTHDVLMQMTGDALVKEGVQAHTIRLAPPVIDRVTDRVRDVLVDHVTDRVTDRATDAAPRIRARLNAPGDDRAQVDRWRVVRDRAVAVDRLPTGRPLRLPQAQRRVRIEAAPGDGAARIERDVETIVERADTGKRTIEQEVIVEIEDDTGGRRQLRLRGTPQEIRSRLRAEAGTDVEMGEAGQVVGLRMKRAEDATEAKVAQERRRRAAAERERATAERTRAEDARRKAVAQRQAEAKKKAELKRKEAEVKAAKIKAEAEAKKKAEQKKKAGGASSKSDYAELEAFLTEMHHLSTIGGALEDSTRAALLGIKYIRENLSPHERIETLHHVLDEIQGPNAVRNAAYITIIEACEEIGAKNDAREYAMRMILDNSYHK